MAKVCVYAELSDGKLNSAVIEIMARARELGDVSVVALGTGAREAAATLGKHGAKVAYVKEDKVFDDYLAEPRYASLKGIMAARSKEVKLLSLQDLGVDGGEPAETIESVASAEARKAWVIIEDDGTAVDHIVKVLAEAKVI